MLEPMIMVLIESKKSAVDKDKFNCRFLAMFSFKSRLGPRLRNSGLTKCTHTTRN